MKNELLTIIFSAALLLMYRVVQPYPTHFERL